MYHYISFYLAISGAEFISVPYMLRNTALNILSVVLQSIERNGYVISAPEIGGETQDLLPQVSDTIRCGATLFWCTEGL